MSQFKRLLGFLRPYSARFFAAVILMAVVGACEALTALLIRPVFDRVLGPESPAVSRILLFQLPFNGRGIYLQDFIPSRIHNEWTVVAFAVIGVTLVKGLSEFFATYFVNFIGHSIVRDLRNLVYSKIIQQSIAFFTKNPTGRLMSAITSDIDKIQNAVAQVSADFLKQVFTLVGLLAVVFYIDWKLAFVSLLLVPLVVFPSVNIGRYIRKSSRSSQDKMAELNSVLQEPFTGIRIVKAFVMELFESAKFKPATRGRLKTNRPGVRAPADRQSGDQERRGGGHCRLERCRQEHSGQPDWQVLRRDPWTDPPRRQRRA